MAKQEQRDAIPAIASVLAFPRREQALGSALLALGILFYVALQLSMLGPAIWNRASPVEPDDAYAYIVKPAQLESCFLQNCPALEALRPQVTQPVADPEVANWRARLYWRVFYQYHPWYTAILYGLHWVGLSWEQAYKLVQTAGIPLVAVAAAAILSVLWGPGAAAIALAFLAFTLFKGQGLHAIVPSNLALAVALLTWAALGRGKRSPACVLGGILGMIGLHPLGRIHAAVTLVLYALWSPRPWTRQTWGVLATGATVLAAWSSLGFIVARPALSLEPHPGWSATQPLAVAVTGNLKVLYEYGQAWADGLGGRLPAGLLLAIGFLALPAGRRLRALSVAAVLFLALGLGVFQRMPGYFGEAIERLWIPFALVLWGAIAHAAWRVLMVVADGATAAAIRVTSLTNGRYLLSPRGWLLAVTLAIGLHLLVTLAAMVLNGINHLGTVSRHFATHQNLAFDPKQPQKLLALSSPGDGVLYHDNTRFFYYLIHGGLSRPAVYFPAIAGTPLYTELYAANERLRFAVGGTPMGEDAIRIGDGVALAVASPATVHLRDLLIRVELPEKGETSLVLTPSEQGADEAGAPAVAFTRAVSGNGWVRFEEAIDARARRFRIAVRQGAPPALIKGLRIGEHRGLNWPWDDGLVLTRVGAVSPRQARPILFESRDFDPGGKFRVIVLDDSGSSVLAELVR